MYKRTHIVTSFTTFTADHCISRQLYSLHSNCEQPITYDTFHFLLYYLIITAYLVYNRKEEYQNIICNLAINQIFLLKYLKYISVLFHTTTQKAIYYFCKLKCV